MVFKNILISKRVNSFIFAGYGTASEDMVW